MNKRIYKVLITVCIMFIAARADSFMFWNQAGNFPGTPAGYIAFGNSASLNITGSFTVEMWLNPVNSTNPNNQILCEKRNGTDNNGYTLYLNQGRVAIRTNTNTRLIGKIVVQNNNWTHVCGTYNSNSNTFSVYVNGVLDTSVVIINAAPVANADSLRIGKGNVNSPYSGYIDEFRIWDRPLSQTLVDKYRRTTLGTSTGNYNLLELSLTFQDKDSEGTDFSSFDWSGNNGTGKNIGVGILDQSERPLNTIAPNDCIELNGTDESLCGVDNSDVSPVNNITMEAWIFPRTVSGIRGIINKGTIGGVNYGLRLNGNSLNAVINGNNNFNSFVNIQSQQWSHVSFTYNSNTGAYAFFINGNKAGGGVNNMGTIINGTDSLIIGSIGAAGTYFNGFIDEVRISNYVKTQNVINKFLYQSIDKGNKPNNTMVNVVYNLDGYAYDNAGNGPVLEFKQGAEFAHCSTTDDQPVSPINRSDINDYQDGYRINQSVKNIPASGISGTVVDSFEVCLDTLISDVNIYLALNHSAEQELSISLVSPDGASVNIYQNHILTNNSDIIITIFDDQADSSLNPVVKYTSFAPEVKPRNPLNTVFAGKMTAGIWKLVINDLTGPGTGKLYSWGVQFNNSSLSASALCLKYFTEGFYRSVDSTVLDTIKVKLREDVSPYLEVGIKGETPDEDNIIRYNFPEADFISDYYIQVNHRNSIEIWSDTAYSFNTLTGNMIYDFTVSPESAYGDNLVQVENSPDIFAAYGADVDQNGVVDLTDNSLIDNDVLTFAFGYVVSDVNGDETVDLSDQSLADNNSFMFVTKVTP